MSPRVETTMTRRQAFFLVLVLIVIVIASLSVYSFTGLMVAYDDAAYLSGDLVQARVAVESGVEAARLILSQPPDLRIDSGGLYNNPGLFQAITVSTGIDGVTPCNFSIVAPSLDDMGMYGGLRFGLQDESARLNINALTVIEENWSGLSALVAATGVEEEATTDNIAVLLLLGLPGMTENVANAILDWLDEDDIERDNSFEFAYYSALPTPYEPSNGPIQSVEELLLVEGVTPTLLFGADANRNGLLDADEQQRFNVSIDTPGALGWAAYLTVHSAEANKRNDGSFRINVNQDDLELLAEELADLGNEEYSSFILAYRIAGQSATAASVAALGGEQVTTNNDDSQSNLAGVWTADLLDEFDLSGGGGTKLNQVLDLIGATVTVGSGDGAQTYASPFSPDLISMAIYMPILMGFVDHPGCRRDARQDQPQSVPGGNTVWHGAADGGAGGNDPPGSRSGNG